MHVPFLASLSLFNALASAIPTALADPPAGTVSLTSLKVGLDGGGCKENEVSVNIAADNSALTVIFDNFAAADGPEAGNTKTRAFCRLNIGMSTPGWAFDITSADFRGTVYLEQGVEASLVSRWKWIDASGNDMKGKGNIHKSLVGPFSEDFFLLHKGGELSDSEQTVCQKKDARLQISLSATVKSNNPNGSGYVFGSSANAGFSQILNLSWRKCS